MSFRDMRNFTEMMRALGYPRLISLENFRQPNFGLVAEILAWLVKQYDPQADISTDTDTEQDRVIFIKSVAQYMATKAHIRLNTKKLYQADGHAVRELLKITSILYSAIRSAESHLAPDGQTLTAASAVQAAGDEDDESATMTAIQEIQTKLGELKIARTLASDITTQGASLYDRLSRESELRELRSMALSRPLEITEVESGVVSSKEAVEREIETATERIASMKKDESSLEAKIKKKDGELERNSKRLNTLKSVRPPWMDDYEKLEVEVATLYQDYLVKIRNVTYLEDQLETMNREEMEKFQETEDNLRRLAEKRRRSASDDGSHGRGDDGGLSPMDDGGDDDDDEDDNDDVGASGDIRTRGRPGKKKSGAPERPGRAKDDVRKPANVKKMYGSMTAESDDEDSDDGDSEIEDTDLVSNDGDELGDSDDDDEDDDDDDDDEESYIEIEGGSGGKGMRGKKKKNEVDDDTDDDF